MSRAANVAAVAALGCAACGNPGGAVREDAGRDAAAPAEASIDAPPVDAREPIDASPYDAAPGPDLQFLASEMTNTVVVTRDNFAADACEVVEGCVGAAGGRTLVRFDTVSANRGTEDVVVGMPPPRGESNEMFGWSECHQHHHVKDYASYELLDGSGVVLTARKQAFCLEDGERIQPGIPATGYTCANQGITRGWADVYSRYLPCQWIDVTDLPSGKYTVRVVVNPKRILTESNYDNNTFTVDVRF
jgi:hypothetical protein